MFSSSKNQRQFLTIAHTVLESTEDKCSHAVRISPNGSHDENIRSHLVSVVVIQKVDAVRLGACSHTLSGGIGSSVVKNGLERYSSLKNIAALGST